MWRRKETLHTVVNVGWGNHYRKHMVSSNNQELPITQLSHSCVYNTPEENEIGTHEICTARFTVALFLELGHESSSCTHQQRMR